MRNCCAAEEQALLRHSLFQRRRKKMEKEFYVIIGLGNPGDKYAHTRHNAGFEVLDLLEEKYGVKTRKRILQPWAEAEWTDGKKKVILCRPLTYMNNSGVAVKKITEKYKVPAERMIVIYDDIDLPPGTVRVRAKGGPGTHNGMRSIVGETGTDQFPRIRVGTGDRPAGEDLVKWVLGRPGGEEKKVMEEAFKKAAECAIEWVNHGIDAAMRVK